MKTGAVIGCGRMGAFTSEGVRRFAPKSWFPLSHAEAIAAHPEVDLTALCDPHPETLARALDTYPGTTGFSSHDDLLAQGTPEIVGIATRTVGRAGVIADCAAAGTRAFHVEKPLCNSVAELAAMESLFAQPDIHVTFGAIRRLLPVYRQALELAQSGRYGRLLEIRVALGYGALYWTHPHGVDLILFAAAGRKVEQVSATLGGAEFDGSNLLNDPHVEAAAIRFDDGVIGHIGRAPGCDFFLACEGGEITVVNDGHGLSINAPHGDDPYPVRVDLPVAAQCGPAGGYLAIDRLVRCLDGDRDARAANTELKHDILTGQRILFSMVESHRAGGRTVALDEIDPALRIDAVTNDRAA